mmetsp:Transcript_22623/g.21789  ORF Transcript_22623/g.21789 Transcript_22623/m.21789 type:complete len:112 (+) Transcript_22623:2062-2397(+)
MLDYIYKRLKKGTEPSIEEAITFMDDMGINNEQLKEHLLTLSMDKKVRDNFDSIDSQTKSLFTRTYNKGHKDGIAGKKVSPTKKGKKVVESEEEDLEGQLIDELDLQDMKK